MKNRLAATLASLLLFGAAISVAALQAPPAGPQRGGGAPGARGGAGAPGGRGGAPGGGQPAGGPQAPGAQRGANIPAGPGGGGRGGPRTPDGALAPNAPHPDPLPIDVFTSKNFYKDKALWSDPKYFRCNISRIITEVWADNRVGSDPPRTTGWGDCSRDIPVSEIKSPYEYKTAKEHYEALMAAAQKKGGPTVHTRQTMPEWDGFYTRAAQNGPRTQWLWGNAQPSTMLSLLTPLYQERMVQGIYHESVTNAPQWSASFCYPEGLLRFYTQYAVQQPMEIMVTPNQVQMLSGIADNFLFKVLIGRKHTQLVPQWYGETIGFWDGDTLVSWTANVQGWTITHGLFEYSSKMETVEITTPRKDNSGNVTGINVETIFYDPDAFVAPLRSTMTWNRTQKLDSPNLRHTFVECLSNVVNQNGKPGQLGPGDDRYVDYYGRPWAKNWEKHFEKDWDKPEGAGLPPGILDIFK
jgi:hypothetical protein